jgi:hypothetical protein
MLAHIERQSWNWDRTIEAVKVVGALIAAVWALVQYGNQVETGRTDAILRAVQVVHDQSTNDFRKELTRLIQPFWLQDAKAFWIWRNTTGAATPSDFYQGAIFAPYDKEFEHVVMFFGQMYDFSAANACAWKVVQDSFRQDAANFLYYFEPIFDSYAQRVHTDPKILWKPLYSMVWDASPAGTSVTCHKSFLESHLSL